MTTHELPYLTPGLPGIGGRIRERDEDFRVEEIPLYAACGEGTHTYFRVTKSGLPTPVAVARIARHMGVSAAQIGYAGLKDAHAVTTQMMSLEHADAGRLAAYRDPRVRVEVVGRHGNKLRPGHLSGNRFTLRIRGVDEAQLPAARAVLDVLERRGVPNYFGPQRFGARGDTADLGRALVRGDLREFVAVLLGRPRDDDPPDCKAARDAFDNGFYPRALDRWPRHYANERRALAAYRKKQDAGRAVGAVDKRMKRLYVSAFQSRIFNAVLVRRIGTLDRVLEGDLAEKADTGGVFYVEDAPAEQPRADRFEISPTGPIPGYRSSLARGEPGEIEAAALATEDVTAEDFRRVGALKVKGTRRALRFRPAESDLSAGRDEHGEYVQVAFTATSGCYATVLLREIMKAGG
jgi:tRNA pseudouridine13 synthase